MGFDINVLHDQLYQNKALRDAIGKVSTLKEIHFSGRVGSLRIYPDEGDTDLLKEFLEKWLEHNESGLKDNFGIIINIDGTIKGN